MKKQAYERTMTHTGNQRLADMTASDKPGAYALLALFRDTNGETSGSPSFVVEVMHAETLRNKVIANNYEKWIELGHKHNNVSSTNTIPKGYKGNYFECIKHQHLSVSPDGQ